MDHFYSTVSEKRSAGRGAHEITLAASQHEKQRFHIMHEYTALVTPSVGAKGNPSSAWAAVFKEPLRLLAILIG